ncbi:MAG TPA: class I SAM-dependent methyltransferase [Acidimicrobiales bacterium]|nr:class I SAM-dependent methyltransferase [Acidimicrobiales bacterium]
MDPAAIQRLSWDELRAYWRAHATRSGALDLENDPAALGNVCWPGAPVWLNEHLGALQAATYEHLLALVPSPGAGERALEVGCGSGRWCRRLEGRGYDVVGIDLQPALIHLNRQRHPQLRFEQVALQDFSDDRHYDLVSSVTVIQHNPFDQQVAMVRRIRSLLKPGGYALILENIRDQADYVFSHDVAGWVDLFRLEGFDVLARRPYDYSPCLRAITGLGHLVARSTGRSASRTGDPQNPPRTTPLTAPERLLRRAQLTGLWAAAAVDRPVERLLSGRAGAAPAVHCGFLFRAASRT